MTTAAKAAMPRWVPCQPKALPTQTPKTCWPIRTPHVPMMVNTAIVWAMNFLGAIKPMAARAGTWVVEKPAAARQRPTVAMARLGEKAMMTAPMAARLRLIDKAHLNPILLVSIPKGAAKMIVMMPRTPV